MEEGNVVLCSGQPPGMATPWNLAVAVFLIPQPRKGHIHSSLFGFFIVFRLSQVWAQLPESC